MNNVSFSGGHSLYIKNSSDAKNEANLRAQLLNSSNFSYFDDNYLKRDNQSGCRISTYFTDDKYDNFIENYCFYNGIECKKYGEETKKDILISKIKPAQDDSSYTFANINADKLNELLNTSLDEDSFGNAREILNNKKAYIKNPHGYYDHSPSRITLTSDGSNITGASFDNPETYFSYLNEGIKDIPILMDSETYNIAQEYGLLSEE